MDGWTDRKMHKFVCISVVAVQPLRPGMEDANLIVRVDIDPKRQSVSRGAKALEFHQLVDLPRFLLVFVYLHLNSLEGDRESHVQI